MQGSVRANSLDPLAKFVPTNPAPEKVGQWRGLWLRQRALPAGRSVARTFALWRAMLCARGRQLGMAALLIPDRHAG
jgi:hypothetical protein